MIHILHRNGVDEDVDAFRRYLAKLRWPERRAGILTAVAIIATLIGFAATTRFMSEQQFLLAVIGWLVAAVGVSWLGISKLYVPAMQKRKGVVMSLADYVGSAAPPQRVLVWAWSQAAFTAQQQSFKLVGATAYVNGGNENKDRLLDGTGRPPTIRIDYFERPTGIGELKLMNASGMPLTKPIHPFEALTLLNDGIADTFQGLWDDYEWAPDATAIARTFHELGLFPLLGGENFIDTLRRLHADFNLTDIIFTRLIVGLRSQQRVASSPEVLNLNDHRQFIGVLVLAQIMVRSLRDSGVLPTSLETRELTGLTAAQHEQAYDLMTPLDTFRALAAQAQQ